MWNHVDSAEPPEGVWIQTAVDPDDPETYSTIKMNPGTRDQWFYGQHNYWRLTADPRNDPR